MRHHGVVGGGKWGMVDDIAETVWLCGTERNIRYLSYLNVDFFPSHLMLKQLK